MSKQWSLPLLVLALAALACGLPGLGGLPGGAEGEPGAAEGEAGAAEAEPGGLPAGEEVVPLAYSGIDVGGLGSYRSQFVMTFVGTDESGAPMDVRYTVSQAYSSNPPASSFSIDAQGTDIPEVAGSVEFVQIGETGYMLSEGECLAYSSDSTSPEDLAFSPDDFLAGSDLAGAQRVLPDENVNGVLARHYRFTQNEVAIVGLTNYSGDIWMAVDGGYLVRQVISADGAAVVFGGAQGHLEWTYDLLDVNAPLSIEPPAGCQTPGAGVPMMADAFEVSAIGGFVSYSTASSVADVVAFYQGQMPAQDWAAGAASTDVPGLATLEFTRAGETASVIISEAEGVTSVIVTVE